MAERVDVLDRRQDFINSLRRHFLRSVPDVEGLEIAVSYQAATEGIGFGGDWYDIVTLDEHRTAFIVGDIAGHGVDAAAEMTVVRCTIHALIRLGCPLGSIPERARSADPSDRARFVGTFVVAVVDTLAQRCDYVTAGHLPPARRDRNGTVTFGVASSCPPLGIATGESRVESIDLLPGSTLVLYSDGLVERRRECIDVGLRRFADALSSCDADAEGTVGRLTQRLLPPEGSWTDDVALIVIRRRPADAWIDAGLAPFDAAREVGERS